ncbi:MAG: toll/interleukin-1 receptor domain-containing protein [Pseudomonadota bacterium]|uniref:toll/interleukin-1 receptor domain-containing protein n=1 Tax=Phenylobacterium sp. TaxID=1871053 RepID=UPI0025F9DF53|nr:toll/interleukin-1 receptor domain-containing protein [Phenylobacterium sp.]MBT9471828.1 toll/interleukin-1 receptor domain-containing protein [Phenylobacterium sp.]
MAVRGNSRQSDAMKHDVFICHASEDKDGLVRPLAEALRDANLDVWYDEFSLQVGDSLSEAIDRGLGESRFGIVVISQAFFQKRWTKRELRGFVAREMDVDDKIILPVWHDVSYGEVVNFSPPLADIRAAMSSQGVEALARELVRKIRPEGSPLLVARDELSRFGWELPPLSDEWWLDIVEMQEWIESPRWRRPLVFPLPHKNVASARRRGLNIAWTALQNDWQLDAERQQICQITHPERVAKFLQEQPALFEISQSHPDRLVNYVPQLLIPEFSGEFAGAFDDLLAASVGQKRAEPDSKRPYALCSRSLALRHPTFGDHRPADIADRWTRGQGYELSARILDELDYVFWLCADESAWLPNGVRDILVAGARELARWPDELSHRDRWKSQLSKASIAKRRTPLKWTRTLRADLANLAEESARKLTLKTPVARIVDAFIRHDFMGGSDERLNEVDRRIKARRAGTA